MANQVTGSIIPKGLENLSMPSQDNQESQVPKGLEGLSFQRPTTFMEDVKDQAIKTAKDVPTFIENFPALIAQSVGGGQAALGGAKAFIGEQTKIDLNSPDMEWVKNSPYRDELVSYYTKSNEKSEELKKDADRLFQEGIALQEGAREVLDPQSYLGKVGVGVAKSLGYMVPVTVAGFIAPELVAPAIVGSFGLTTFGETYGDLTSKGFDHSTASWSAGRQAAIEVGTELIGGRLFGELIGTIKQGKNVAAPFVKQQLVELASEELATTLGAIESSYVNIPEARGTVSQILSHMTSPAFAQELVDTAVATVMQGGITSAAMYPVVQSYKRQAVESGKQLKSIIEDAKVTGQTSVNVGGREVSITELESTLSKIQDNYSLTDEQLTVEQIVKPSESAPNEETTLSTPLTESVVDEDVSEALSSLATTIGEEWTKVRKKSTTDKYIESVLLDQTIEDGPRIMLFQERLNKLNPNNKSHQVAIENLKDAIKILKGETQNAQEDEAGLPSQIEGREESIEAQPVESASREETPAGGDVQDAGTQQEIGETPVQEEIAGTTPEIDKGNIYDLLDTVTDDRRIVSDGSISEGMLDILNGLAKLVGLRTRIVVASQTSPNFKRLYEPIKGGSGLADLARYTPFRDSRDNTIAAFVQISPLNVAKFKGFSKYIKLELMAHEIFGHALIREKFEYAPVEIKRALEKDFLDFVQNKVGDQTNLETAWRLYMPPYLADLQLKDGDISIDSFASEQLIQSGLMDYTIGEEWLASGIAKALLSRVESKSIIERFWSDLSKSLNKLWNAFSKADLDLVTGVTSQREFVDWLITTAAKDNKLNVENLNTKDTVSSIVDLLFETDENGKRKLKEKIPKFGFADKSGVINLLSKKDIKKSGFTIKESKIDNETYYIVADKFGLPIFKVSHKKYSKNNAWQMAKFIRDMMALTSINSNKKLKKETIKVGDLKFKIIAVDPKSSIIRQVAKATEEIAQSENMSERAALLYVLSGRTSIFRKDASGLIDKYGEKLVRVFTKYLDSHPDVAQQLHYLAQPESSTEEDVEQDEMVEEAKMDKEDEGISLNDQIEQQVRDLIDSANGKVWIPNNTSVNLESIGEFVKERFDFEGKDFYRSSAEIRGIVNAEIKRYREFLIQRKNGEKITDIVEEPRTINGYTEEELIKLAQESMVEFDISVFHGTSRVIEDVPTMDKADPDALYGPGIYTTEDYVDPDTGHLVVTAGYSRVYDGVDTDIVSYMPEYKQEVWYLLKTIDENLSLRYSIGESESQLLGELEDEDPDIGELAWSRLNEIREKYWEIALQNHRPNILPLEIDPDPTEKDTFDIDTKPDANSILVQYLITVMNWKPMFESLHRSRNQQFVDTVADTGDKLYNLLVQQVESKANANAKLVNLGYNFITHIGGGRTGGVDHRVWIALKDGLVKSKFAPSQSAGSLLNLSDQLELSNDDSIEVLKELDSPTLRKPKGKLKRVTEGDGAYLFKTDTAEKKRKSKPKTQVEYEALAAKKKEKDNNFAESFGKIVDKAREKNLSVTEYLESLPIPDKDGNIITDPALKRKEISTWWNRWMRITSMVSQTETILRLSQIVGIVNLEDNTKNLAPFIKSIWPNHSGEITHLDSLGKEIVIDRLQKVIEARFGERYDMEKEPRFEDLKNLNEEQFDKLPWYRKMVRFGWFIQARTQDQLNKTQAGRLLVTRLKRTMRHATMYQRDYKTQLRDLMKFYQTDEARTKLYRKYIGEIPVENDTDRRAITLFSSIAETYGKEMEKLQIKIWFKSGKFELFKYNPAEPYFPHMWKDGAFTNPTEEMIKGVMVDLGLVDSDVSRKIAAKHIRNFGRRHNRIYSQKFANMEMARETNLGGFITDPFEVFTKYVDRSSKRMGLIKEFGHDTNKVLLFYALEHYRNSKEDPDAMKNAVFAIQGVTGMQIEDVAREFKDFQNQATLVASALMLQHAFLVQPGIASNVVGAAGFVNTIKGFAELIPSIWGNQTSEEKKQWSKIIGADAFTVSREVFDAVTDQKTKEKTDRLMKRFGITAVDSWMRFGAALTGRLAVRDAIVKLNKGSTKEKIKAERFLRWLSLDVERLKSGSWTEEDINLGSLAFVEETNFVSDPLTSPAPLRNNPWGRVLTLFNKFAFHQHGFMKDLIKRNKGGAFKQALAGLSLGTIIYILRTLAKGEDPEKVMEENGLALTLWRIYSAAGGLGLFAEMLNNALIGGYDSNTAIGSTVQAFKKGGGSFLEYIDGDPQQNDANAAMKSLIMGTQVGLVELPHPAGQAAAAGIGLVRPALERALFPTESQEQRSLFE